jgi:hypothetical protein
VKYSYNLQKLQNLLFLISTYYQQEQRFLNNI